MRMVVEFQEVRPTLPKRVTGAGNYHGHRWHLSYEQTDGRHS